DAMSRQYEFEPSSPLTAGAHRLTAQVIDRFGQQSNQADLTFNVTDSSQSVAATSGRSLSAEDFPAKAPNQLPTVAITAPANGATYGAGASITLMAVASDPDGSISKVEFYRGGSTLIGTVSATPYALVWSNAPTGSYAITAKAYDNKNGAATSSAVTVSVV